MTFRILAVDGGGIRGVYPAQILAGVTEKLGIQPNTTFQLAAGTSTGAIIAAAVALGLPMNEVVKLYVENGRQIFQRRWLSFGGKSRSQYSHEALSEALYKSFGNTTLGSIPFPLIIPATDISTGNVHVFKSGYDAAFLRDKDVKLVDAILASCSAPMFFDPYQVNEYLLADGGLWANNPALVARTEALTRLKQSADDIRLLSLGTGTGRTYYGGGGFGLRRWGFLTGWERSKFIELLLNLQSLNTHNTMFLTMARDRYMRISFECADKLPLDDASAVESLRAMASRMFTERAADIRNFLEN